MSIFTQPHLVAFLLGGMEPENLQHRAVGFLETEEIEERRYLQIQVLTWNTLQQLLAPNPPLDELSSSAQIPIQSLQKLTQGGIHLHLLVNSWGGKLSVANTLKSILDAVHQREGTSIAYGGDNVCSAAALVFSHTQKRYALGNTTFLFHGSRPAYLETHDEASLPESVRQKLREERADEMKNYKRMLLSQVRRGVRARIRWTFDIAMSNPENRLLDAFFRGEDLLGFVKSAFTTRRNLWNAFARELGADPTSLKNASPQLNEFFQPANGLHGDTQNSTAKPDQEETPST